MTSIKFVDSLPLPGNTSRVEELITELAVRRGQWAEIARFPAGEHARAYGRGNYMKTKDSRVQIATRSVDGAVVLFARVA